jgi:hypothetical protein
LTALEWFFLLICSKSFTLRQQNLVLWMCD